MPVSPCPDIKNDRHALLFLADGVISTGLTEMYLLPDDKYSEEDKCRMREDILSRKGLIKSSVDYLKGKPMLNITNTIIDAGGTLIALTRSEGDSEGFGKVYRDFCQTSGCALATNLAIDQCSDETLEITNGFRVAFLMTIYSATSCFRELALNEFRGMDNELTFASLEMIEAITPHIADLMGSADEYIVEALIAAYTFGGARIIGDNKKKADLNVDAYRKFSHAFINSFLKMEQMKEQLKDTQDLVLNADANRTMPSMPCPEFRDEKEALLLLAEGVIHIGFAEIFLLPNDKISKEKKHKIREDIHSNKEWIKGSIDYLKHEAVLNATTTIIDVGGTLLTYMDDKDKRPLATIAVLNTYRQTSGCILATKLAKEKSPEEELEVFNKFRSQVFNTLVRCSDCYGTLASNEIRGMDIESTDKFNQNMAYVKKSLESLQRTEKEYIIDVLIFAYATVGARVIGGKDEDKNEDEVLDTCMDFTIDFINNILRWDPLKEASKDTFTEDIKLN